MSKQYYVYILASKKYGILYIGVTNVTLLMYYEIFDSINEALLREKQMKIWKRDWKINKIEGLNPEWNDLYPTLV